MKKLSANLESAHAKHSAWRHLLLLLLFLSGLIYATAVYGPSFMTRVRDTAHFRDYVLSFGPLGIFVLMAFQVAHIVIPMLPGELVQIAGGFIYGTAAASGYLFLGTAAGTVIVFCLVRWIGYPLVSLVVSQEKMSRFAFLIKSRKIELTIGLLFLLPGIPKDILIYICGLTPIKPVRFILISLLARTPGLIGSAFIGARLMSRDYHLAIGLLALSTILLLLGIGCRRLIFKSLGSA